MQIDVRKKPWTPPSVQIAVSQFLKFPCPSNPKPTYSGRRLKPLGLWVFRSGSGFRVWEFASLGLGFEASGLGFGFGAVAFSTSRTMMANGGDFVKLKMTHGGDPDCENMVTERTKPIFTLGFRV